MLVQHSRYDFQGYLPAESHGLLRRVDSRRDKLLHPFNPFGRIGHTFTIHNRHISYA
jgi:hypothetical protein